MAETRVEEDGRRFFQRTIRAFVVKDCAGFARVIPVVYNHFGRRAKENLTWKGFRARPGDRIVAADLSCGHRLDYARPSTPGSMRTAAPCRDCKSGQRAAWEMARTRRQVRTALLEIAGQPTSLRKEDESLQAEKLGHLVEFVVASIEARCLPAHSKRAEEVFARIDRHGRLSGVFDPLDLQAEDGRDEEVE